MAGKRTPKPQRNSFKVVDRASRRRFVTRGSALLITGTSTILASTHLSAADCDRNPKQTRRCSDNDSGENSDPRGCGRCGRSENVPAEWRVNQQSSQAIRVKRIKYSDVES